MLNVLGLLVGLGSLTLGGFLAVKTHGALMSPSDGTQPSNGATQGIGYLASAGIGIGGVIVGLMLTWAGYVLRTLAVVASRPDPSAPRVASATQAVQQPLAAPIPALSVPGFGEQRGSG